MRGSQTDAQLWAAETETALSAGTYREPSRQTARKYLAARLDGTAAQRVCSRTLASYRQVLTAYVIPALGDVSLAALALTDVDQLDASLTERGLSSRTVRYTASVLRHALRHAVKGRLIQYNPSDHATLPRSRRTEIQALSADEARAFLLVAQDDRWHALWTTLLTTGMRPSEAFGVTWGDVDGSRVSIRRALVHDGGGRWHFDECKTPKSRRADGAELVRRAVDVFDEVSRTIGSTASREPARAFAYLLAGAPDHIRTDALHALSTIYGPIDRPTVHATWEQFDTWRAERGR